MGGQGLRALSDSLFKYDFLTRLNLPHNNLQTVSPALGKLRKLEYLDLSFNHLQQLPEEIGMLTNLKTLHISGNKGLPLPWALGYLYNLEFLSVMDCRLPEAFENAILEGGTRGLINFMLENMPGKDSLWQLYMMLIQPQMLNHPGREIGASLKMAQLILARRR